MTRMSSLACIRHTSEDGRTRVGCGRGWTAPEVPHPVCDRCGRSARVTGSYSVTPIAEPDALPLGGVVFETGGWGD